MELNIPQTGLDKLESLVGLPDFSGSFSEEDYVGNQASHFQEHFASQIVLRRLSVEFHTTLTNGKSYFVFLVLQDFRMGAASIVRWSKNDKDTDLLSSAVSVEH